MVFRTSQQEPGAVPCCSPRKRSIADSPGGRQGQDHAHGKEAGPDMTARFVSSESGSAGFDRTRRWRPDRARDGRIRTKGVRRRRQTPRSFLVGPGRFELPTNGLREARRASFCASKLKISNVFLLHPRVFTPRPNSDRTSMGLSCLIHLFSRSNSTSYVDRTPNGNRSSRRFSPPPFLVCRGRAARRYPAWKSRRAASAPVGASPASRSPSGTANPSGCDD
jgi:hypothetical protein